MQRYPEQRKLAVLKKLLPPNNLSVPQVAADEGISEVTLYNWRKQARNSGVPVPGSRKSTSDNWSADTKLSTVIETSSLNEQELSEYCRRKGLYPEQVNRWKVDCLSGISQSFGRENQKSLKTAQRQIRDLSRELRRKDKALAESAALLVLQKKYQALWEDEE